MVKYHRYYQPVKKSVDVALIEEYEKSQNCYFFGKKKRSKLFTLLFISLLSCSMVFTPQLLNLSSDFSRLYTFMHEDKALIGEMNGTICCDRRSVRSDICIMKGDVRTHSPSSSLHLYISKKDKSMIDYVADKVETDDEREKEFQREMIRPYTRKWEKSLMSSIVDLTLVSKNENSRNKLKCDVQHDVPAVFFSTGGYTGNVYHEFNDGILPLYITSQHFNKRVMFVILEYHNWWYLKYRDIISQLSDFRPIDFNKDKRVHCFPEAIVGLRIHDELTIDPSLMENRKTIRDFRYLLDKSFSPRVKEITIDEKQNVPVLPSPKKSIELKKQISKPKLVIISRDGSRTITNQRLLVKMAENIGFQVEIYKPVKTSELAKIYQILNSSDVMVGVHGAAMTHLLFMRPGSVFIQVIPLGTGWASEAYYGAPAKKLGLKYIGYEIHPKESSLYDNYPKNHPVLTDPNSLGKKGWNFTKKVFLDHQNVRLNLGSFRKRLVRAYEYSFAKKNSLS